MDDVGNTRFNSMDLIYLEDVQRSEFIPYGTRMLRGGTRTYSPCVLDRSNWFNFYLTLPKDYDIRNDPQFNLHRSTYKRLGDGQAPLPEPTTAEMTRTGFCGPDPSSLVRPAFLRYRDNDKRPEPAFRLHLSDRTSLHYMRSDPMEGILPFGRQGDMSNKKSVTHRDYIWRQCCPSKRDLPEERMERKVHRMAKTDLHGRFLNEVVKFEDDFPEKYFDKKLMKLKKAFHWPMDRMTGEPVGGYLLYHSDDPCVQSKKQVWPNRGQDVSSDVISIPHERCSVFGHGFKEPQRTRPRHFHQKSYLDMRYPIRNYECWEEVPNCCGLQPKDFPQDSNFVKAEAEFPCHDSGKTCSEKCE